MPVNLKGIWNLLKASVNAWSDDKSPRLGAALSFYTVFAMPPLFMIAIFIAGFVFDPNSVRTQMFSQVGGLIGEKSAEAIQAGSGFDMNHRRAVIGQVFTDRRAGGEGGEFDDLDTF